MGIGGRTGRELEALVAEQLFGLEVEERTNSRTGDTDVVSRASGRLWVRVAFYTASMGASLNVQLTLQDRG